MSGKRLAHLNSSSTPSKGSLRRVPHPCAFCKGGDFPSILLRSRLQIRVLQRDRFTSGLRARSRQGDAERTHRIVNRNGWLAIVPEIVDEILELDRVGVAESLHEEWHGVVRYLILGHHE